MNYSNQRFEDKRIKLFSAGNYFKQNDCFPAQIEEVSDTPLLRVIEKLGGWPVTDSEWNSNNAIDLETLVAVIKRNFTLGCRPCPFIQILSRFFPDFIQILSRFYPDFIYILSRFYLNFIQVLS